MKQIQKHIGNLIVFLGLSACASFGQNESPQVKYPKELAKVRPLIQKKYYKDARGFIDSYLNKSENLEYFGHAYFLKGYILELEGESHEAMGLYRRAIQHANRYDSLVQAKALYNLSFSLEREGKFDELMTVLADLVNRPQFFRTLTAKVETPARMGAALASLGQLEKAATFHKGAKANYDQISRANWFRPTELSHTKALYYLGVSVYPEKNETFASLHKKLELGESYLLRSAEASVGSWATKGTRQLLSSYTRLWKYIEGHQPAPNPGADKTAIQREKSEGQLNMASDFYDLLVTLRPEEFPLHKVNRNSKQIIEASDLWMKKLEKFALSLNLGPETIREKPVSQRPLVQILDEEWKRRSTRVNKEQSQEQPLEVPIGAGKVKPTTEDPLSLPTDEERSSLKKALDQELKKGEIEKRSSETRKKAFEKLPEKDPNL